MQQIRCTFKLTFKHRTPKIKQQYVSIFKNLQDNPRDFKENNAMALLLTALLNTILSLIQQVPVSYLVIKMEYNTIHTNPFINISVLNFSSAGFMEALISV